jgi:hypothetical protein
MKLIEMINMVKQAQQFKGVARSIKELRDSVEHGLFTLDGRELQVSGDLSLDRLGLIHLFGCPQKIHGSFSCKGNKLKTLEGGPMIVGGEYDCSKNMLKELNGAPLHVYGDFNCSGNYFISFVGGPRKVDGDFYANDNPMLASLDGAPKYVGGSVFLEECHNLTSIRNVHLYFPKVEGEFNLDNKKKNMLGLLEIQGLKHINIFNDSELEDILNKCLKSGKGGIAACIKELIDAGYSEQAKL